MSMKKTIFVLCALFLQMKGNAVTVETTANLNVYYPEYTRIGLVWGKGKWKFMHSIWIWVVVGTMRGIVIKMGK